MSERWVRVVVGLLAVFVLLVVARQVDWPHALHVLGRLGMRAPLVAVPYFFVISCDTLGWRATFERSHPLGFWTLLRIRVATEAVSNSLPLGPALAEGLRAVILQRRIALPLSEAAANVVIARFALALSQGVFLIAGLGLAVPTLQRNSHALIGRAGLEWVALGVALAFLLVLSVTLWLIARGRLLGRFVAHVGRWSGARGRRWLQRTTPALNKFDHALGAVERVPRTQLLSAIGCFALGWVGMSFENYVILRLLSANVTAAQTFSMEAVVSIVRIVFVFLPAALGAQEASYYLVLRAYGVDSPEVTAAAFMIAKRAKEIVWMTAGYALLGNMHVRVKDAYDAPLSPGA